MFQIWVVWFRCPKPRPQTRLHCFLGSFITKVKTDATNTQLTWFSPHIHILIRTGTCSHAFRMFCTSNTQLQIYIYVKPLFHRWDNHKMGSLIETCVSYFATPSGISRFLKKHLQNQYITCVVWVRSLTSVILHFAKFLEHITWMHMLHPVQAANHYSPR